MNIVINALSARQGGGQTYIKNILENVPKYLDINIFVFAPECLWAGNDSRIQFVNTSSILQNPFIRTIWEKIIFPRTLKKLHADVLFCPGGVITTAVPKNCMTVTMFRNMIPFDLKQRKRYPLGYQRLRNYLLNRVMLKSMMKADLLIFISQYAQKVIERAAGKKLNSSVVIPHGVNEMFRMQKGEGLDAPSWLPKEGYLLYVSTLEFYKAQIEVVRAYRYIRDSIGISKKMLLVGPENKLYGHLVRKEIRELELERDIIIKGKVPYEQLPLIYHFSTVNIFASESENCPNILLESLASGAATVSSSCSPMPEFAGEAVLYFDPSNPLDIAGKIITVLSDETVRNLLQMKAVKQAAKYEWKQTAADTWSTILSKYYSFNSK